MLAWGSFLRECGFTAVRLHGPHRRPLQNYRSGEVMERAQQGCILPLENMALIEDVISCVG